MLIPNITVLVLPVSPIYAKYNRCIFRIWTLCVRVYLSATGLRRGEALNFPGHRRGDLVVRAELSHDAQKKRRLHRRLLFQPKVGRGRKTDKQTDKQTDRQR